MASPTLSRESYPFRMRAVAAISGLFAHRDYRVRRGLLRGMYRHGGLGWIPSGHLTLEEQWYQRQDFTGQVVYDVGGFHGLMSVFFAKTAKKVFVFEPLPEHQKIIALNASLNGLRDRVAIMPYGAAERDGRSKLVVDPLLPGTASADPSIAATIAGMRVPIELRAIDGLGLPAPEFCKIDVEGMELAVLLGMERTLQEHHPQLVIEIHGVSADSKCANATAVISFLRRVEYSDLTWLETGRDAMEPWGQPEGHLIAK